jgi:hypothetical protein
MMSGLRIPDLEFHAHAGRVCKENQSRLEQQWISSTAIGESAFDKNRRPDRAALFQFHGIDDWIIFRTVGRAKPHLRTSCSQQLGRAQPDGPQRTGGIASYTELPRPGIDDESAILLRDIQYGAGLARRRIRI